MKKQSGTQVLGYWPTKTVTRVTHNTNTHTEKSTTPRKACAQSERMNAYQVCSFDKRASIEKHGHTCSW